MTPAARKRMKIAGKIALSALVLGAVVKIVGAEKVADAARRLTPTAWFAVFAAFLASHSGAALKWRLFIRLSGGRLSISGAYRAYAAGLFANLCLPSMIGGDVLRAGLAMRDSKQKEAVLLGSLIDRLSDFVGLALLAAGGMWALPQALKDGGGTAADGRLALTIVAGLTVAGVLGALIALKLKPPRTWPLKLRFTLLRAALAMRRMKSRPLPFAGAVLLAAGLQAALLYINILLGRSMGVEASTAVWFFCWPLAKIVAMLPVSFGGFGVREAAFAGLCSRFGVPAESATATSLAWQSVLIAGGLVGGAYWGVSSRRADVKNPSPATAMPRRTS